MCASRSSNYKKTKVINRELEGILSDLSMCIITYKKVGGGCRIANMYDRKIWIFQENNRECSS